MTRIFSILLFIKLCKKNSRGKKNIIRAVNYPTEILDLFTIILAYYSIMLNIGMKSKIKEFLEKCPRLWRARNIKKYPEYVEYLEKEYPNVSLNIQIDSLIRDRSPYCIVCDSPVKKAGKETCSFKCRSVVYKQDTELHLVKRKQTCLKKYGVENVANVPKVREKRNATMIEKYGALVSDVARQKTKDRATNLNIKGRKTIKEKYGVDNPGQIPKHYKKVKATILKNYGVDNYYQSSEYLILSKKKQLIKWRKFIPNNIEFLEIKDPAEYKTLLFADPNQIISFKCLTCGVEDSIPTETVKWRINNTGTCCAKCSNLIKGSNLENEVRQYVKDLGIDTIDNGRSLLDGNEIDIYIPEKRIGIEFNGLFWHNDLRKNKNYHIDKLNLANSKNIQLIQIFEDEWIHRSDIVKSRIAYLLDKVDTKIYARKCIVREVNYQTEKEFLNNNHIMGYAKSSVRLGLYQNNTLVSIMTFSKPNLSKGQQKEIGFWELLRFCNKVNTSVVGGANKLLQHFIRQYSPNSILSFADKRWSVGNLYKILGFKQMPDTQINYWYIHLKEMKRIHRFNLRKNTEDDQDKTEYENRLAQGYLRIWDCGSSKWVWTSK